MQAHALLTVVCAASVMLQILSEYNLGEMNKCMKHLLYFFSIQSRNKTHLVDELLGSHSQREQEINK